MILGTTIPKIQSTSNQNVSMSLYDSELDPTFMDPNVLQHKSVINGTRNYIPFGDYAEFDIVVNIHKGNVDFTDLKAWDKQDVYLYPHNNGLVIKDKFYEPLKFTIQSIEPYYLTQDTYYDVAVVTMKSKDYATYYATAPAVLGYGYQYGMNYGYGL